MDRQFFEKTWLSLFEHCNGRAFDVEDWLFEVRQVGRFDLICFKERPASSDRPCLGRIGDMMLHARDRIRVPFHSFTIPRGKQDPEITGSAVGWHVTYGDLLDAVDAANQLGYTLTFSTLRSGATLPLSRHFQLIPDCFDFHDVSCKPFRWLFDSAPFANHCLKPDNVQCDFVTDPVNVLRLRGPKKATCKRLFTICLGYDHLMSFNLIVRGQQASSSAEVYFVPRRHDGKCIPETFPDLEYGAFELGGLFLCSEAVLSTYEWTEDRLRASLCEITPQPEGTELRTLHNVLKSF